MGVGKRGGLAEAEDDEQEDAANDGKLKEEGLNYEVGGREGAGELVRGARGGVIAAVEEALPGKYLVTLASCVVGLLTGVGVVLFNQSFLGS